MLKLAGFVFWSALSLLASDDVRPLMQLSSEAPAGARYEVLETPTARHRLDRFTGKTWRMADTPQGSQFVSHRVELEYLEPAPGADSLPRYQITHGNANYETLVLIDTDSGRTWRFVYDATSRKQLWKPVEEPNQ